MRGRDLELSVGCLVLFALPFLAVGAGAAVAGIHRASAGDYSQQTLLLGVFAVLFGGGGVAMLAIARYGGRRGAQRAILRERHPDQPWLWRADWAEGKVEDRSRGAMAVAWALAVFWNAASLPLALIAIPRALQKDDAAVWLMALFPAVGIGLLVWAVRSTLRWRRYGGSTLTLDTLPGLVGGRLTGTLASHLDQQPAEGVRLTLSCVRITRGRKNSRSERVVWDEQVHVPASALRTDGRDTLVPVDFIIPSDCLPTDDTDYRHATLWRLHAGAALPGVDYAVDLEVPVFRTAESRDDITADAVREARDRIQPFDRGQATVRVGTAIDGGTEFYFGPFRDPSQAVASTVVLLLWCGATWLTVRYHAPVAFPILMGLFGALMFVGTLDLWFGTTRTVFRGDIVVITSSLRRRKNIPVDRIRDVRIAVGSAQQSTAGQTAAARWNIQLVLENGRTVKAGGRLREKREAEWLVGEMKELLPTLPQQPPGPGGGQVTEMR